jgi:hypothetical protein
MATTEITILAAALLIGALAMFGVVGDATALLAESIFGEGVADFSAKFIKVGE